MTNLNDKIAALKAELDLLKASLAPAPIDHAAEGAWRDQMHQASERRAFLQSAWSRSDLEEMEKAAPTNLVRDIVRRDAHAPTNPCGYVPSTPQEVQSVPRNGPSGWIEPAPLSNPPGIGYVDMLCEVDAAKQRGERMVEEEARRQALLADKPK